MPGDPNQPYSETDFLGDGEKWRRSINDSRGSSTPPGGPGGPGGFGGGRPFGFSVFQPSGETLSPFRRRLMMALMRRRGGMGQQMRAPQPMGMPGRPPGMGTMESPVQFASGGYFQNKLQSAKQASGLGSNSNINKDNPAYDASNPYGWLTGQTRNDWLGQGQRQVGKAGEAGFFDPMGSPAIREAIRRRAMQAGDTARARTRLSGDVYGLDPAQKAFGNLQSDLNAQGDVARIGAGLEGQMLMDNQDYFRGVQDRFTGDAINSNQAGIREAAQRDSARRARKGANSLEGLVGGIAGQALGGWVGGFGGGQQQQSGGYSPDRPQGFASGGTFGGPHERRADLRRLVTTEAPVSLGMMPLGPGGGGLGRGMSKAGGFRKSAESADDAYEASYGITKGQKVSPAAAAKEIRKHGLDPADFMKEMGKRGEYTAREILEWLGY